MLQHAFSSRLRIFHVLTWFLCIASPGWAFIDIEQTNQARQLCIAQLPLEKMAEPLKTKLSKVVQNAQIFERSKPESFPCNPDVYRWLLESPDASLFAWKKLGATKAEIVRQENGSFLGKDGTGGELRWNLVASGPLTRIWFAEGSGRIGPLLPTMTIRALVFLHFSEVKGIDGRTGIKHRIEILVHYDSIPLVNRITSMTAESTGKKAVQQLELFFSGMAWYASEHSAWTRKTFQHWASNTENRNRVQQLFSCLEPIETEVPPLPPGSR
ncbi:MAG: hypothetical protein JNJ77_10690 [Planctomycetia bacterium]|nr:hypothetical protein [Planctomycetia bacterium]